MQAIFSDDSDDDIEDSNTNKAGDPEKKTEVATSTLNRLIAGDFLESLGKELGMEVPPDMPYSRNTANTHQIETSSADAENAKILSVEDNAVNGTSLNPGQENTKDGDYPNIESTPDSSVRYSSKFTDGLSENISGKVNVEKFVQEDKKVKSPSRHRRNWSSSSLSEDESSRKHSKRHRYRSSDSYSDSSSDHRDRYHSRSKGRRKKSTRQKSSSSRKHSKHHKHRNRDSPTRSRHGGSEREHSEARKEKRKRRE